MAGAEWRRGVSLGAGEPASNGGIVRAGDEANGGVHWGGRVSWSYGALEMSGQRRRLGSDGSARIERARENFQTDGGLGPTCQSCSGVGLSSAAKISTKMNRAQKFVNMKLVKLGLQLSCLEFSLNRHGF